MTDILVDAARAATILACRITIAIAAEILHTLQPEPLYGPVIKWGHQ